YCCRVQNVPFARPVCPAEEVRYLVSSKERGCGCRSDRPCAKWSCLRALEDSENRPPSVLRSWVMDRSCAHPSTQPCPGRSTYADGVHRSPAERSEERRVGRGRRRWERRRGAERNSRMAGDEGRAEGVGSR